MQAEIMQDFNDSCEPMDVDLSSNSHKPMDLSFNEVTDINNKTVATIPDTCRIHENYIRSTEGGIIKSEIRKYHIKVPTTHRKTYKLTKIYLSGLFLIILAVIIQRYLIKHCAEDIDLGSVKKVLQAKLYGQAAAVGLILKTLNEEVGTKMLFLYGGTGVGKTYAVSLILDKMWNSPNIYHYTSTSFLNNFSPHLMIGMTFCKKSIIVVDNLDYEDMDIKNLVTDVIEKSLALKKSVTVILIYNCDMMGKEDFVKKCETSFRNKLETNFASINTLKVYIPFEPLREEHLRQCIANEFENRKITKEDYENLMKNFNVTLDGCKGVYAKTKFLNI